MTNNLKLITTESFGDLPCNFYRNMNDDILLTREQIGTALEYKNPDASLSIIHKRHANRLDSLSVVNKVLSTDGKEYNTTLYCQRGIMEICRWSNKPKANIFMDWVWDIVEKYRNNELKSSPTIDMTPIIESITSLNTTMTKLQEEMTQLKESSKKPLPVNKYSRWKTVIFKKLNTLTSYVNENSDENLPMSRIMGLVFNETQDTYDIDLNDYTDMYRCEYGLSEEDKVQTLDVVNHYKDIRDMFTLTLDSIMAKLHLQNESDMQTQNIFDVLAAKMEN